MIRVGVLGTANIAERRMVPAILHHPEFSYAGASIATREETARQHGSKAVQPTTTHTPKLTIGK